MVLSLSLTSHVPILLEFKNLNYTIRDTQNRSLGGFGRYMAKEDKAILKNLSGTFRPGELTAIMGPSGAGKSTLMNILAGYKNENVKGNVSVNGEARDLSKFRRMSCYVMQDDVHLPQLTVLESMRYTAELTLPRTTSENRRENLIQEILDTIGLTECRDVRASKISGGQRKRLSIAIELINNTPLIFLDEPSSGLDSASCASCIALLKSLAEGGRTVVATIHQPSSRIFEQFDSLYLLGDGRNLYGGPISSFVSNLKAHGLQCPEYHNPADFAIEVAIGDYGPKWPQILVDAAAAKLENETSSNCNKQEENSLVYENGLLHALEKQIDSSSPTQIIGQQLGQYSSHFATLFRRSLVCVSRDMVLTHLRLASTILVGLLIGSIYHDAGSDASKCFNNAGNLFFGLLFLIFSAMMTTVLTFPLERGVLVREHLNCWYSLKSYYLARTLADLPFQLFFPIFYILLMYYMTDQPLEAFRIFIFLGIGILVSLVAQTIGLLIGAACTNVESAVFLGPISAIPFFLFSGCFMTLSSIPAFLRWISWISYVRYAFQSILTAIYGYDRESLKCTEEYCHFKNPKKFLEMLGTVNVPVATWAGCLVGMLIGLRIVAYWALRWKIKSVIK